MIMKIACVYNSPKNVVETKFYNSNVTERLE